MSILCLLLHVCVETLDFASLLAQSGEQNQVGQRARIRLTLLDMQFAVQIYSVF